MKWLLPALLLVPAAEIMLLLYAGNTIGIMPTLLLILISGIGGVYLAKRQGLKALTDLRNRMGTMEAPGNAVIDGVCIFFGAILLILPGFISDIAGLFAFIQRAKEYDSSIYRQMDL